MRHKHDCWWQPCEYRGKTKRQRVVDLDLYGGQLKQELRK